MNNKPTFSFAIIGLGKVGTAIGHLLHQAGHNIVAVADKSAAALANALPYTGGAAFDDPREAARDAECVIITTPDDIIADACNEIADSSLVGGKLVFHMSGAGGLDLLESARQAGAVVASIHPVQSFSSVETAINNIPGSVFGITAVEEAKNKAEIIVRDLQGIPIFIAPEQKTIYHAAACFASNYLVTLLHVVEALYESIGMDSAVARKAYLPLVHGTINNIVASGSIQALTGPIARGDAGTIAKHVAAIDQTLPQYSHLYSIMGLFTSDIAQKKGTLSAKQADIINELLKSTRDHSEQRQP